MRYLPILLLSSLSSTYAFQLPFKIPFFQGKVADFVADALDALEDPNAPPRIAIIGAGAGGSSAAFWISKAKERFGLEVEIDVYDRESYVGGRSTVVYPHDDTELEPIELGASVFVKANRNMWRASEEFKLKRKSFAGDAGKMGVFDGEKLILSIGNGWWDTAKILWRYGILSPKRTNDLVKLMISKFLTLYSYESPRWDNIAGLAETLGWTDLISNTTSDYLQNQGVSQKYVYELIEAATRVNYGQNVDEIHALEGACSLAASDTSSIRGGNFQVFEHFLKSANATVLLSTPVTSIVPKSAQSKHWTVRTETGSTNYRAVIFAAPFHQSGVIVPLSLSDQIPSQPYVKLHVTLLTTTLKSLSPIKLGLAEGEEVPNAILTTYEGKRTGGKEPEFNSMAWVGKARAGESVVKIFSKEELDDEWLQEMFNGTVGWVHRKEWQAYPKLPPTTSFPPVKLDDGFYYVNAFEPFISTMETSTLASRNVVELLLNEEFRSSICGARLSAPEPKSKSGADAPDFVFGWDC